MRHVQLKSVIGTYDEPALGVIRNEVTEKSLHIADGGCVVDIVLRQAYKT